ncbi:hypothetical protein BS47DRAFT_1364478 [Hydnum rufescens UP504]|uniref:Uncharacterized protein n=1 Tax=Hydnum rufescens UP504 TaxID=1448309 RepID=A0A9P6DPW1_9AGAM|nr:hypothetical protein BS47DRAFT_1364478 [Hydnum rufescens UP504]
MGVQRDWFRKDTSRPSGGPAAVTVHAGLAEDSLDASQPLSFTPQSLLDLDSSGRTTISSSQETSAEADIKYEEKRRDPKFPDFEGNFEIMREANSRIRSQNLVLAEGQPGAIVTPRMAEDGPQITCNPGNNSFILGGQAHSSVKELNKKKVRRVGEGDLDGDDGDGPE